MGNGDAYDSRADTLAHIHRVRDRIDVFVGEMLARGRAHDASKLEESEKAVLDRIRARGKKDLAPGRPRTAWFERFKMAKPIRRLQM